MGGILHSPSRAAMASQDDAGSFHPPARSPYDVETARKPSMSKPLVVSIPHRLGREEALRRIKAGLAAARNNYSMLLNFHEETWSGDHVAFNVSALGQNAAGTIDVGDDQVRVEVRLPWLLSVFAEKLTPAIRKEGTLMLEKPRN